MDARIILGIDPGLANTGWGVIAASKQKLIPLAYGCIQTYKSQELPLRLCIISDELKNIVQKYNPQEVSVESIFFCANTKSAMLTAQARGAALCACGQMNLDYAEYTPMQIKQALVGTGAADKYQVQYMVKAVLNFSDIPKPDHAADALAAAICHARMKPAILQEAHSKQIYEQNKIMKEEA